MKRKLAVTFAVLGVLSAIAAPANAAPQQQKVTDILDHLIVCVMAPCP